MAMSCPLGMHASGVVRGCPHRRRMARCGSVRLPACCRIIFAGFAAARIMPRFVAYMASAGVRRTVSAVQLQHSGFRPAPDQSAELQVCNC